MKGENLYCKGQRFTNEKFRNGYEQTFRKNRCVRCGTEKVTMFSSCPLASLYGNAEMDWFCEDCYRARSIKATEEAFKTLVVACSRCGTTENIGYDINSGKMLCHDCYIDEDKDE